MENYCVDCDPEFYELYGSCTNCGKLCEPAIFCPPIDFREDIEVKKICMIINRDLTEYE